MIYKKMTNEKGSALLISLMILLMITAVSFSMFSISSDDLAISSNSKNMT